MPASSKTSFAPSGHLLRGCCGRILTTVSPDDIGEWQFVDYGEDFTIQYVDSFPDIKIQFVEHWPGVV